MRISDWSSDVCSSDLVDSLLKSHRSVKAFCHSATLVGRYVRDRLSLYRRGTRLALGNALAGRLLQSAVDAGVTLWSDVRAMKIFQDADGAVIGLEIERDGRLQTVRARRGVVLATGDRKSTRLNSSH